MVLNNSVMTKLTDLPTCPDAVAPNSEELLNANPVPAVIIDGHYRIVAVNQSYCERYGVGQEEIVGRRCHDVSHGLPTPCSEHGEQCPLETAMRTGRSVQVVHVHRREDGSEERVQLEATPVRGAGGAFRWVTETLQRMSPDAREALLVGRSQPLLRLTDLLLRVAPTDTTVLLLGESGTGKERAAEYLHAHSRRAAGPLVVFDCGGFSEGLIESELFGYEKGAFTGAAERKLGLFEAAAGGTLFIDEIGDLPLALQGRLLRVLESQEVRRVGGTEYVPVDVRIVAATNRDLQALADAGLFRKDLLYRLSAFPVRVPTLRERLGDIPLLASQFLAAMRESRHLPLSAEVCERLTDHTYPGNVRELRNVLERAVILADRGPLRPEHIVFDTPGHGAVASRGATLDFEPLLRRRGHPSDDEIIGALTRAGGHRTSAARELGISERTLYRHLTRLRRASQSE